MKLLQKHGLMLQLLTKTRIPAVESCGVVLQDCSIVEGVRILHGCKILKYAECYTYTPHKAALLATVSAIDMNLIKQTGDQLRKNTKNMRLFSFKIRMGMC